MNILYIHGLSSSGNASTSNNLRLLLPDHNVFSPDLPIDPQEALTLLQTIVKEQNIDIAVGTSMGGMFAQKLRGTRKIIVNPAFHVSRTLRKNIGINPFFNKRADGATEYEITEEICQAYEELESAQFDNLTDEERNLTYALFGTDDDVVNCEPEYLEHYTHCAKFTGGHRLSLDNLRDTIVPLILKAL